MEAPMPSINLVVSFVIGGILGVAIMLMLILFIEGPLSSELQEKARKLRPVQLVKAILELVVVKNK
jgi:quinol-cytochrome oxidoreductase complex cytochrome b subunit